MVSNISWIEEVQINRINCILNTVGNSVLEDTFKARLCLIANGNDPSNSKQHVAARNLRIYLGHFISVTLKPTYRKGSWAEQMNGPAQKEALQAAEDDLKTSIRNAYPEVFHSDAKVDEAMERIHSAAKRVNLDEITAPLHFCP